MKTKNKNSEVGIAAIGISIPPFVLPLHELAQLRNVDVDKYIIGLGLQEMALCANKLTVVDLATKAAQMALDHWEGDIKNIGLLAVGTETPVDNSRPLSAWVADQLKINGHVRSYEVKHACYGGTLAIKQAVEWYTCSNQQKAALVIAVDEALYAEGHPGEPTQGAGAVAFIIEKAKIAKIATQSIPYSEPVFDFWKPLNEVYPRVDGQYSLECYKRAAIACFKRAINSYDPEEFLNKQAALCFHVPYPKMVKKAFYAVAENLLISERSTAALFENKTEPYLEWNKRCGNAYTASLWIAVCNALASIHPSEELLAFSYGSGLGAEILTLQKTDTSDHYWANELNHFLNNRIIINAKQYMDIRTEMKLKVSKSS